MPHIHERMKDEIHKHRTHPYTIGLDSLEINNWRWTFGDGSCNR